MNGYTVENKAGEAVPLLSGWKKYSPNTRTDSARAFLLPSVKPETPGSGLCCEVVRKYYPDREEILQEGYSLHRYALYTCAGSTTSEVWVCSPGHPPRKAPH